MPLSKTAAPPTYTIYLDGQIRRGAARDLLKQIRDDAAGRSPEVAKMDTEHYASVIIDNAQFYLPKGVLDYFATQEFESEYERALRYLAEMPESGVRVLSKT